MSLIVLGPFMRNLEAGWPNFAFCKKDSTCPGDILSPARNLSRVPGLGMEYRDLSG
jgi:hypothetical protein